jgi:hypothetical protein
VETKASLRFFVASLIAHAYVNTDMNPRRADELMKVTAHPQGVNKKLKADENEIFDGARLELGG